MTWTVRFHREFLDEFRVLDGEVQDEMLALAGLLRAEGPHLKRPHADTLGGSVHANMKELRFEAAGGVWRVAYAFDPERSGILLVAGDKAGVSQKRFYKSLIRRADERFGAHLRALKEQKRPR